MEVISREDAREEGRKHFYTGVPCPKGHLSLRYVSTRGCVSCLQERAQTTQVKEYQKQYQEKNKDKIKAQKKEYTANSKDRRKAYLQSYNEKHKNKIKLSKSRYYLENKQRFSEARKEWKRRNPDKVRFANQAYTKRNKDAVNSSTAKRRARKKNATPSWLTDQDYSNIRAVYTMADRLSSCLGVKHHVDHIIPLDGKVVCGLHVPWNLRAIPAAINLKKADKIIDLPGTIY